MKFFNYLFLATLSTLPACGKKSTDTDKPAPAPAGDKKIPRWEPVDRKELKFNYLITNNEAAFQLTDDSIGAIAMQPWLKLKGLESESMEFVMMFEAAPMESCKKFQNNKSLSWKGLVFDSYPDDQVVMFEERDRIISSGKHQSIIHFLIFKNNDNKCAKLTFYNINLKGYDHGLSIFDKSELSKAILVIAASVRLK